MMVVPKGKHAFRRGILILEALFLTPQLRIFLSKRLIPSPFFPLYNLPPTLLKVLMRVSIRMVCTNLFMFFWRLPSRRKQGATLLKLLANITCFSLNGLVGS
ncbi:hypothetical protein ES332_A01G115200v1 [Gossypium tomentosum]|uniref:Uncharacterized protein n=1 Tax=Gossypium tomentosum TaxID=34277 RepID=A0A5D2RPC1_GOSTO|nr:hypothetical protein ES332_A01G115200v1 [Gossypium tomentosum]